MLRILESIHVNQYYEFKRKGKFDMEMAKKNADILLALALVLNIIFILALALIFIPDLAKDSERYLRRTFGRNAGRSIGKFLVLIPMVICYLGVKISIGRKGYFKKLMERVDQLSEDEQKAHSDLGMTYFIVSLVLFLVPLVGYGIYSLF